MQLGMHHISSRAGFRPRKTDKKPSLSIRERLLKTVENPTGWFLIRGQKLARFEQTLAYRNGRHLISFFAVENPPGSKPGASPTANVRAASFRILG
jgi:hypothetical protein